MNHKEFKPILDWVIKGNGNIVYGGTKYFNELKNSLKYLKIFIELKKIKKVIKVDDKSVDDLSRKILSDCNEKKLNDEHIIAIVILSKCRIVCTQDKSSFPFLKNKKFYQNGVKRPSLYTSSKNSNLLIDSNIVEFCKPCVKLKKEISENFYVALN
ncbi:MAG: hypothetical protein KJ571_18800 [Bacteroidetes bacterium]|nr:hypothetical protein [Bacteroidota bacterium]